MADVIEFASNYSDISTDQGFQFEFRCDRCSTAYRTKFQSFAMGTVSSVLDGASSIFGGIFGQAANVSERVRSAGWQKARDDALAAAIREIKPTFVQCPKCQGWVCRGRCWNNSRGLCKNCAPDLAVEMSAAQSAVTVQKVYENAAASEEDQQAVAAKNFKETLRASCPSCGEPLAPGIKFCSNCGAKVSVAAHCTECGAKLAPGAKFCAECGTKVAK
jgi:hypothetical protein